MTWPRKCRPRTGRRKVGSKKRKSHSARMKKKGRKR